jgi:benzoyl-CoA 2,3-dioxygenase component B
MNEAGVKDPYAIDAVRGLGVIDLPTIQRKINFHIAVSRDLFGAEVSTNAANSFNAGIKGRFQETRIEDDHQLEKDTYTVLRYKNSQFTEEDVPALSAINARLLDDYIKDCQGGVNRWNKVLEKAGMAFNFQQPHKAFNRRIGEFANIDVAVDGEVLDEQTWQSRKHEWLPTDADLKFLVELMQPVTATGEYASWIASPKVGIDKQPGDFEYVRI